mmetsp:Transcript_8888/g.23219  ORF Transcript_8888/g.23219 Transcript_8888/m.23219 type:complete len:237 (+) Transcript_8888:2576-3286(+)
MDRPDPSSSSSSSPLSPRRICSYVLVPTAITSILPSPSCTSVPLKTRGVLSGVGSYVCLRSSGEAPGTFICWRSRSAGTSKWPLSLNSKGPLLMAWLSPVSAPSKIFSVLRSNTRPSAVMMSPVESTRTSPTTTSLLDTCLWTPPLMTFTRSSEALSVRARNCFSLLLSWMAPTRTTTTTATMMARPSSQPRHSMGSNTVPMMIETTEAHERKMRVGSCRASQQNFQKGVRGFCSM